MKKIFKGLFKSGAEYSGNYSSWSSALGDCSGYADGLILEEVRKSAVSVLNGDALFERDSVLFYEFDCSWAVLSVLLKSALENEGKLSVLDFGGSLGSSYFQFKHMIPDDVEVLWNVVEQKDFVSVGRREMKNDELKFYCDVSSALEHGSVDVLLLSSVLPYIKSPMDLLAELIDLRISYLLIDRTPCFKDFSRLTKQTVPDSIYDASYPAWFLNKKELVNVLSKEYRIISLFDALGGQRKVGSDKSHELGFICQLKD
jgi:putative methyltransferase (TIGR04325 family)